MRCRSQQPSLGKAQSGRPGDDEMVKDLHVHQRKRLLEVAGQVLIGLARLRDARGMVMRKDHGGGIRPEGRLHDFAGVDARLRERPPE